MYVDPILYNNPNITGNIKKINIPATVTANKISIGNINKILNNFTNSDNFLSTSANAEAIDETQSLILMLKRFLYNEQFRELVINSNPELKNAYDNFIASISVNTSELGEYIKAVLEDTSKFSGDFFNLLNKLISEAADTELNDSIYNFLKIFDNYFTQTENAYGVNSAFNNLLSGLPTDMQNALLNSFTANSTAQINIFLLSIFDTKLPDAEKLKLALTFLLNMTKNTDTIESDEPINIFYPTDRLSSETLSYINTVIKEIKSLSIELPDDIKAILKSFNTDDSSSSILTSEKSSIIHRLAELSQGLATQYSKPILHEKISQLSNKLNSLIFQNPTEDADAVVNVIHQTNNIDEIMLLSNYTYTFDTIKQLTSLFDSIGKVILSDNTYKASIKNEIALIADELATDILETLIYSDITKNKCELLLNIYENTVMPVLLKNNDILDKKDMSVITHNMLKLKLGTADEFYKQVNKLFSQLTLSKSIDNSQLLFLKNGLIKKLLSDNKTMLSSLSFINFLNMGIEHANNDAIKSIFQNTLLTMISKDDFNSIINRYIAPLVQDGKNILSEIIFKREKKIKDQSNDSTIDLNSTMYQITLVLDIEDKGVINAVINYLNKEISVKIIVPDDFGIPEQNIPSDIASIIKNNHLLVRDIIVTETNSLK